MGRLVETNALPQATDPDGDANNVRYTYDIYGNMTSRDWGHDGNFAATGTPADFEFFGRQHIETSATVEDNRIHDTGFAYDANGNMTRYVKDGGGVGSTWTPQNRMSAYYSANPETSGGVVAERYVYDADGYRVAQYPDSPHTGDGIPVLSIRDAAGQLLAQFEHKPLEANPTLKKEFVSGLGQLLVERDVVEAPSSVSTNSALESGGSYGFQVLDNPVASEYTIDIRTHSGIVAQLQNQAPDGSGILWIPSTNFADADTNFIRVRKQDGSTSYSVPVTLSTDSSVTGSSANQVRAISSARVGANVEIRWDLLQQNGQTTYVHFERADGGGTILLPPLGVPSGITSLSLLHQAPSAPCGTVFTTTSPSSTLNPSVGAETKNFGHLENTAEPACGTPPSPSTSYSLANSYHHRDHLGSLRVVTDEAGATKSSHDYYPFGGEFGASSTTSSKSRFTGHERDTMSGMDYMLARFGSSAMGRFISVDPLRSSASTNSAGSWNRYSYVLNNLIMLVDPDGQQAEPAPEAPDSTRTVRARSGRTAPAPRAPRAPRVRGNGVRAGGAASVGALLLGPLIDAAYQIAEIRAQEREERQEEAEAKASSKKKEKKEKKKKARSGAQDGPFLRIRPDGTKEVVWGTERHKIRPAGAKKPGTRVNPEGTDKEGTDQGRHRPRKAQTKEGTDQGRHRPRRYSGGSHPQGRGVRRDDRKVQQNTHT